MLAFLVSPIGRDLGIGVVILLLIAGLFGYYEWTNSEIKTLENNVQVVQQQAADLAATNAQLQADVDANKAALDSANLAIVDAQNSANKAAAAVRANKEQIKKQAVSNPRALETQINNDHAALLKSLQGLSQ